MVQTLNEQPHVTFEAVDASVFFDYGELLDNFYKPFPAGAVQGNPVFWVESTNPTVMFTKETAEEPTIPIQFQNEWSCTQSGGSLFLLSLQMKFAQSPMMTS